MPNPLTGLIAPALLPRLTLLLNHVLSSEDVAMDRLRPHAGRSVSLVLQDWPALLPAFPPLAYLITPAGLLEWCAEPPAAADLTLRVDARNPALLLSRAAVGERPTVGIEGDARLAADVDWLMQNLRWDIAADLEKVVGPIAAEQLSRLGAGLAAALRAALQRLDALRPKP